MFEIRARLRPSLFEEQRSRFEVPSTGSISSGGDYPAQFGVAVKCKVRKRVIPR